LLSYLQQKLAYQSQLIQFLDRSRRHLLIQPGRPGLHAGEPPLVHR